MRNAPWRRWEPGVFSKKSALERSFATRWAPAECPAKYTPLELKTNKLNYIEQKYNSRLYLSIYQMCKKEVEDVKNTLTS